MNRYVIFAFLVASVHSAAISNDINATPRIHDGEQLISAILSDCLDINGMSCLKGKVLTYLDTILDLRVENARAFNDKNVDKVIFDRVSRVLATNEIQVELPQVLFGDVVASYSAERGIDFIVSQKPEAARGLLKKKLLFPVLLLLKLKMKALMPIFVALIGLKAMKALILSKLAITIVLGFVISQLVKKTGLGMPMMSMMPAAMEPMNAYGPPTTAATPDSSYGPPAWEPASPSASYQLRNWEPSAASSSHNLAYSSYYPNTSSYSSSSSGSSPSSSQSATSSSSGAQAQAY